MNVYDLKNAQDLIDEVTFEERVERLYFLKGIKNNSALKHTKEVEEELHNAIEEEFIKLTLSSIQRNPSSQCAQALINSV